MNDKQNSAMLVALEIMRVVLGDPSLVDAVGEALSLTDEAMAEEYATLRRFHKELTKSLNDS